MDSPKPPTPLNSQNTLSVIKGFGWGSLNLENFWLYISFVLLSLNFTTKITLRHLVPMSMNKNLRAKTTKYFSKNVEMRKICEKSNLSFIRVIKKSSFDQCFLAYMVKIFPKIIWSRFLVPRSCSYFLLAVQLYCVRHKIFWPCQCY